MGTSTSMEVTMVAVKDARGVTEKFGIPMNGKAPRFREILRKAR